MKGLYLLVGTLLVTSFAFGQAVGDYRSFTTGNWNSPATWERFDGVSWVNPAPTTPASADGIITIMDTHVVTVTANVTADQIEWDASCSFCGISGVLIVSSGSTLTINNGTGDDVRIINDYTDVGLLQIEGSLSLSTGATIVEDDYGNLGIGSGPVTSDTYKILDGGVHIHTTGVGVDVIPSADWQSGSTCQINATSGTVPFIAPGIIFSDFLWNGTAQSGTMNLAGALLNVARDFTVSSTNGNILQLALTQSYTLTIGRDFLIQGNSRMQLGATGSPVTVNVGRDLLISSSSVTANAISFNATGSSTNINVSGDFSKSNASTVSLVTGPTGTTSLNVSGNFLLTGGVITRGTTITTGSASINFNGVSTKTFTNSGTITNAVNFVVANGKTLDLGTSAMTGAGSLTVNGTGTLRLGSLSISGALQTAASGGNIQVTGTRTYSSSSTIVYNGLGPQFIGNGFPPSGNVNLTISNPSGVTLSDDLDIVALRTLFLSSGNLIIGTQTLTINGTITGSGGVVGGATSNLTIGGTGPFGTLTFSGTNELLNFTVNRGGATGLVTLGGDLTVLGAFTHTDGEINFNNRVLRISGDYTNVGGTFSANESSTMIIDGAGAITGNVPLDGSIGTFTLDRSTGATVSSLEISNALNLLSGTLTGNIDLVVQTPTDVIETIQRGDGALVGTLSATSYDLVYSPTTAITTGSELLNGAVRNFTKSSPGTLNLNQTLDINGVLTMNAGTFSSAGHLLYLAGNYIKNGGTTDYVGSTISFDGNTTLSGASTFSFPDIEITGILNFGSSIVNIYGNIDHDNVGGSTVAGTGSVTFTGNTTLTTSTLSVPNFHNLTVSNGSTLAITCAGDCGLEPNQFGIRVNGNWNTNGAGAVFDPSVIASGSKVELNGTTQSITMLPTQAFSTLELSASSAITLSQPLNVTNDLVIGTTASLNTGPGSQTVNVGDDFIVNGAFTANNGTVVFNGTSAQFLDRAAGSGTATKDFYNIAVDKTSGTFNVASTIAGTTFRVANEFRISQNGGETDDVDFDGPLNNGRVVLRSTSGITARIPAIPAGVNTIGNLTVERYIQNDAGVRAYRYLASPVSGTTVSDWQAEIPISGTFSNPSTGPGITSTNPSLYRWVETAGGLEANRYQAYPATGLSSAPATAALENGRGYAIYVRSTATPTADVRGTLNEGNVNVGLTITGAESNAAGYNLVGNPYPAPVDWDLLTLPGGVSSTISMKNNVDNANTTIGQFVYYTQGGVSVGNFDGIIASGQAFWVQTASNATLQFTESSKASNVNPIVVREAQLADVLHIKMYGNGLADETVLYLRDDATEGVDVKFDAEKRPNDFLNLYTFFDSESPRKLAINGFHDVGCSKTIHLGLSQLNTNGVNVIAAGTYNIEFQEMASFNPLYKFFMVDAFAGKTTELTQLKPVYTFSITSDAASFGDGRFQIMMLPVSDNIFSATAQNVSNCGPGIITLEASGAPANGSYRWYESVAATETLSTSNNFSTPQLSASKKYYVSVVNATGCEGTRTEVSANIVTLDQAAITTKDDALVSNYDTGNQWYLNGVAIEDAVNQTYVPLESGLYKLEVTQGNCTTSAERQQVVTAIEDNFLNGNISIYPNPVENRVTITVDSREKIRVRMINTLGVDLGTIELGDTDHDGKQTGQWDMSAHPAGIYIMNVQVGNQMYQKKILKK